MKAIRLKGYGGLERLTVVEMDEPGAPQEGEILVRLHASSLNYHDYLVATGKIPTAEGLIPLSDGAGIVEGIGKGVKEFAVGDHVVSCFFPEWQDGEAVSTGFAMVPGDGVDGYARERVAAVVAYCESLRGECRAAGVRVVTLLPGYIATPLTAKNPYPMPFLMQPADFADQAFRAIAAGTSYRVIPWPMGVVAKLLRLLPNPLFDRVFAGRGRKPRRSSPR
jgi:hypothetical protein